MFYPILNTNIFSHQRDGSFSWKFVLLHSATLLVEVSSNRRVDLSEETSLKFPQKKKRNIIVRFDKRNNFKPKIITNKFLHLNFSLCQWIKKWHTDNQIAINRQFFNIYIFILLFLHFLFTLQKKKKESQCHKISITPYLQSWFRLIRRHCSLFTARLRGLHSMNLQQRETKLSSFNRPI